MESPLVIVDWIRRQVEIEIRLRWSEHGLANVTNTTNSTNGTDEGNVTNGTDSPPGSGSGEGETEVVAGTPYYNAENYTLPAGCNYTDEDTIFCKSGLRSVSYNLPQCTAFFESETNATCAEVEEVQSGCQVGASETNQCFRMKLFNKFQLDSDQELYAWLYFDKVASKQLYSVCAAQVGSWANFTYEQFKSGFNFNFGPLGPQ